MAASRPPTLLSTASSIIPLLRQSQFLPYQTSLQRRFQTILEGARERWMYAIYWEYSSAHSLLVWGDGYYNLKGDNGKARKTTSPAEQAQRKSVLRLLSSFISGPSTPHDHWDEDVTDPEWFFILSMGQTFVNGGGLPGQAFFHSSPVFLTGSDQLSESACQRARQLQEFGLQTMVCIPCPNGVVELASTEVVVAPSLYLMIAVQDLFNFNWRIEDLTSGETIRPRKDERLHERASIEKQNHENDNLSQQSRGKEKKSDSKCSWFLSSGSSEGGSASTYSHSTDYSGPS